jgi:fluoride ion exporter CrcB/FEX
VITFSLACSVGCLLRYGLEVLVGRLTSRDRIWGTLVANILGCGVVGLVFGDALGHAASLLPLCGGLTSFSAAFAGPLQTWQTGEKRRAIAIMSATPVLCIAGFLIGAQF